MKLSLALWWCFARDFDRSQIPVRKKEFEQVLWSSGLGNGIALKRMVTVALLWSLVFASHQNLDHDTIAVLNLARSREVSQNWNFLKHNWSADHLKALNEKISEWAHFLNLTKRFWRYLTFSAQKKRRKDLQKTCISRMAPKRVFLIDFFCNSLGLNPHNFAKIFPNIENKDLFYAKFYGA